jgi:hypothetical protein
MSAADSFLVRSLYETCVDWSSRDQNRLLVFEEPQQQLTGASLTHGEAMTDLSFLALWYGALTVRAAWEGRSIAPFVANAHRASLLSARVAVSSFDRDTRRRRRFRLWRSGTALDVARALAYGWVDDAKALSHLLRAYDASGLLNAQPSPMVGFVQGLIGLIDGQLASEADLAPAPETYRRLLHNWDGEPHLVAEALSNACRTRIDWASDESQVTPEGPLSDMVYAVWPVELLALLRIRQTHSLPSVVVDHPLMTVPLGAVADPSQTAPNYPALLGFRERHAALLGDN